MPIDIVTKQAPQQNSNKPKPTCHHCKKPSHYQNQCRQLKREKDQTRNNTNSANINNGSTKTNSNLNNNVANNTKANNINNQRDRRSRPVFPPCETCGRTNHSTEKCYLGANSANRPPPRNRRPEGQNQVQQSTAQSYSDKNLQAAVQTLASHATSSLWSCMWQTGDKWNIKTSTNSRGCLAATYGDRYRSRQLKLYS